MKWSRYKAVCRTKSLIKLFNLLVAAFLAGCGLTSTSAPSPSLPPAAAQPGSAPAVSGNFSFPSQVDPTARYLFYLHGKIIEDQGLPAVSPEFGEYQYGAILQALRDSGFVVISEQRPAGADSSAYAQKTASQVEALLRSGVPANRISLVGASKGAGITILASHMLKNPQLTYVLLAICEPVTLQDLIQNQIYLTGRVLSIYDSQDEYAGSCADLFRFSEGKGLTAHNELVLTLGKGHGILYSPLKEWLIPTVEWAKSP